MQTANEANVVKTTRERDNIFKMWTSFCDSLSVNCSLSDLPKDPETRLTYLLVFGMRYRKSGRTGKPVRADTVEKALLAVGEGITHLGEPDPRLQNGKGSPYYTLLASFLKALRDQDEPATRVYPATLAILEELLAANYEAGRTDPLSTRRENVIADLCIIGFYWLLRPAEYTGKPDGGRTEAFRLCDIQFTIGGKLYSYDQVPLNDTNVKPTMHDILKLQRRVSHATLTFVDQKNTVRGEQICHQSNKHLQLCPCKALLRIAIRLRLLRAERTTPINAYKRSYEPRYSYITAADITEALRDSATQVQHETGIDPSLISARSLRPGGATALLCAGHDPNVIQLVGRWKSDAMLKYLRVHALAQTANLSTAMLENGRYTFHSTDPHASHDVYPDQTPNPVLRVLTPL